MRNLLVVLTILALFLLPMAAHAQGAIKLDSVSVDLWPEYDQPGLLVIYHIQMASDTVLPVTLPLRIPASAQVNAVAALNQDNGLVNAPYQSIVKGDWSTLSITANSLQVQVEYYVSLEKDGVTRPISYVWPGDQPVNTLDVNFLLPPASDQVKVDPAPITTGPGQGGLTNYLMRTANLPAGQTFTVSVQYERQTDELSIASLPVQAVSTPGTTTPGLTSAPSFLPWLLGGLGVVFLAAGGFAFYSSKRGERTQVKKNGRHNASQESQEEAVYCDECGKRAQPGDLFCRTCGARLKQDESA